MDSQLNTLEQGMNEEEKVLPDSKMVNDDVKDTESPSDTPLNVEQLTAEHDADNDYLQKVYTTKQEILERVREIAHGEEAPRKEEVDYLKTVFYKLHIAERDVQQREYLEAGGNPDTYSSIINNNMNTVMRTLTSVSIIMMFPTLIASLFGMNLINGMETSRYGFVIALLISFVVSGVSWWILRFKRLL